MRMQGKQVIFSLTYFLNSSFISNSTMFPVATEKAGEEKPFLLDPLFELVEVLAVHFSTSGKATFTFKHVL